MPIGPQDYVQYVILSPSGTKPDGFNTPGPGFCAWHDYTGDQGVSSSFGDIAFTNMPYVADMGASCGQGSVNGNTAQGKLDGFSIVEGREYAETLTDQVPAGGWTNHTGDATYNGQENGDECAWVMTGAQAATQNVAMGTGTFAMQSTWANDTNACAISHPPPEGPMCDTGVINATPLSCAAAGLANYTGTAYMQVYSQFSGGGVCMRAPAPGFNTSGCSPISGVFLKGVPITGISEAAGASTMFTFMVPSGAANLTFKTTGGSGDVDLYVKLGATPTTSSYLAKSDGATTTENVTIAAPAAGTYYVMVYGYAAASGVTLIGDYSTIDGCGGAVLCKGVPVTGIAVASGASKTYTLYVPAGTPSVTFQTSGGTGDADLYVSLGSAPTTTTYLKRSNGSTNAETITLNAPAAGNYYVMVRGYSAASGASLVGKY